MKSIKIIRQKIGNDNPDTTVTIPASIFKIAAKLIPKKAMKALRDNDIDIEEIQKLSENPEVHGTILEAEDHVKGIRVIVSIE